MKTKETTQDESGFPMAAHRGAKIGTIAGANADPISENQVGVSSEHMKHPTMNTEAESFFIEPANPRQEARSMASAVISCTRG